MLSGLRARLLALVLLASLPALGMLAVNFFERSNHDAGQARSDLLRLTQLATAEQQRLIEDVRGQLETLAYVPALRDRAMCSTILSTIVRNFSRYTNLGVANARGEVICSAVPLTQPVSIRDREYFQRAIADRGFSVGGFQIGRITGKPAVNLGYPIFDKAGRVEGVVYAALDLKWIEKIAARTSLPIGATVTVLDQDDRVLVRVPDDGAWFGRQMSQHPLVVAANATLEGFFEGEGLDGLPRLTAFAVLHRAAGQDPVNLLVSVPRDQIYADANRFALSNLLVLLVVVALTAAGAWFGADVFVLRKINTLLGAMKQFAAGNLAARAPAARDRNELNALAAGFNDLAATLEARTRDTETHLLHIARLNRVHAMLSGINGAIVRIRDREELLNEACRLAVEIGDYRLAWVGLIDPETRQLQADPVHASRLPVGTAVNELIQRQVPIILPEILTARKVLVNDAEDSTGPVVAARLPKDPGWRALTALPLFRDDRVSGVLALYAGEADHFDADEMALLEEVAADLSFGLAFLSQADEVRLLSNFDAVTGLPNRTLFMDRLNQSLARAHHHQRHVAVLALHLARLKEINSLHGYRVGDAMLREYARRIAASVREGDTVARTGSSSFGVVLTDVAASVDPAIVARKIADALRAPHEIDGQELFFDAEIGVAIAPGDGKDGETLVRNANSALNDPRRSGMPYRFYTADIHARARERNQIESELHHALERNEIHLHYQPVVDLATLRTAGGEALMRWTSTSLGSVSPAVFIPAAEASGLILPLGEWAVEQAIRQAQAWFQHGLPAHVAVNCSAHQLQHADFEPRLHALLDRLQFDPGRVRLTLEITESELMVNPEATVAMLEKLRRWGLSVSIDDFGTGYSSLSYLHTLPVDELKIDISFVRTIRGPEDSPPLVRAILGLARDLGLKVVAEGVETPAQLAALRRLGCPYAQGFLFSPAVAPKQFEALAAREFDPNNRPSA